ncbi:MAG: hypothetical protein N2C14_29350, partial [Planctomycetales bacterium]
LVALLVTWHLWCDRNGKAQEQRQINNNLNSIQLAQAAGFQFRGNSSTVQWLETWGKAAGKDAIAKMLKDQGADKEAKYAAVLKKL